MKLTIKPNKSLLGVVPMFLRIVRARRVWRFDDSIANATIKLPKSRKVVFFV